MKIGKYNFPTAKMSKNQRAYLSQLKRIFDEATTMGIDVDAQEFVEMYFPMKVTKEAIENVSSVTAFQMFNVASKQDTDRMYVDNFMNNWPDGQPGKPCDDMSRPGNSPAQIVCLFHNQ